MHKKVKHHENQLNPCHVGIHWKALAEFSQMSTHLPWFQSFLSFLSSFYIAQISNNQLRGYPSYAQGYIHP